MSRQSADDTQEYPTLGPTAAHGFSSAVAIDVAGLSHTGHVRANNEDHFLIVRFGRFLEALGTNLPADESPGHQRETGYTMVVADGMGAHAAREVASKLAISSLVDLALTTPDWILRLDPNRANAAGHDTTHPARFRLSLRRAVTSESLQRQRNRGQGAIAG
jgi:serine/threonine protein phosphatase PrpC